MPHLDFDITASQVHKRNEIQLFFFLNYIKAKCFDYTEMKYHNTVKTQ